MLQAPTSAATIDHMETMQRVGVIHLSGGGFTVVDPERVGELNVRRWSLHNGYVTSGMRVGEKTISLALHRVVMRAIKGQAVDHRHRDKLDNREASLRFATKSQNAANAKKLVRNGPNPSKYKGVALYKGGWSVSVGGKYIGRCQSEIEAAKLYNTAALERYGEFARLNEIP